MLKIQSNTRLAAFSFPISVNAKGDKVEISLNGESVLLSSIDVATLIDKLKDAKEALIDSTDFTHVAKVFSTSPDVLRQLEKWHRRYVPPSGTASSIGGNLVRYVELILYRFYNDGDMVGTRGRDPSKIVNKAASNALNALYSINQALGIETYNNGEFEEGVAALNGRIRDETQYKKALGKLAEYTVKILEKAEPLEVFTKRSIKPRESRLSRSSSYYW